MENSMLETLDNLVYVFIPMLKASISSAPENKREKLWKSVIQEFKDENKMLMLYVIGIVNRFIDESSQEGIDKALKVYKGEEPLDKSDKTIVRILNCMLVIEIYGIETPERLNITIAPASAERLLKM